jgi:hypothetical protein
VLSHKAENPLTANDDQGTLFVIQGVQKVTKPMAYLESVSWTPHFKDIVASTIPGLKSPRLLSMEASQGYCVFISSTHTLQELQDNIQRTVDRISTGILQNVFTNMVRRVHLCEERNGGHFQHLL